MHLVVVLQRLRHQRGQFAWNRKVVADALDRERGGRATAHAPIQFEEDALHLNRGFERFLLSGDGGGLDRLDLETRRDAADLAL